MRGVRGWKEETTLKGTLNILRRIYEPLMAMVAVALALSVAVSYLFHLNAQGRSYLDLLGWGAWAVFVLDFLIRWRFASHRPTFLRRNWIEFLALLPFGLFFAGFFSWYRAVRAFIMLRRYSEFFHAVFLRHGFMYMFLITFGLVFAGAYAISQVEPGLGNFSDALWWSFVTTTTVGYGDIAPKTTDGRLVAVVLMLLGIGFIGLFTGSVASFFMERLNIKTGPHDAQLDYLKDRLDQLGELTHSEFEEFQAVVRTVYDARHKEPMVEREPHR